MFVGVRVRVEFAGWTGYKVVSPGVMIIDFQKTSDGEKFIGDFIKVVNDILRVSINGY
uniref:Uncharacterized protein n=1 Tax=Rhizophagus irregularis (strain DAOM 181602 / DAOM 197198 / MUCL 43194) TaxID=747089 RepID=U9TKK0_RHIID